MKLTRLRLHGSSRSLKPTDFVIEPGLTGVVGPNGCGKSNLVEALRWAMGETSHKSLRAADMDAVIFAGSGQPPLAQPRRSGDDDRQCRSLRAGGVNDREILEISRRIERDAGSVYRINGRDVRARDVQILFADAATGARSPALVHQGKIGEIIQAKPEQRRRVLEDAAGVAGLHARRHEAELRLKAAETNLTRVEDVVGQLAGQIDGLKKQARQANPLTAKSPRKCARPRRCCFICAGWRPFRRRGNRPCPRPQRPRTWPSGPANRREAARIQALRAAELPALREARPAPRPDYSGSPMPRNARPRGRARKERVAELDRRLTQSRPISRAEQQQTSDAEVALQRLDAEDTELKDEIRTRIEKRSGVDERASEAETTLAAASACSPN